MKNRIISRVISASVFGIIAACAMHIDHAKRGLMGREAFLAKQAARYDRHFAHPESLVIDVIACLFLLGILFAAYELIAFVGAKVLAKANADDPNR